jgi:iron complex transport system permease protein
LQRRLIQYLLLSAGLFLADLLIALATGDASIPLSNLIAAVRGTADAQTHFIVFELRLPRTLVAAVIGAALAGAGAIFQSLLRNPLADPFVLGISGGAATGAVLVITTGISTVFATPLAAFVGALAAMSLVYGMGRSQGRLNTNTLLLAGVIANAFFTAVILFVMALADPSSLMRAYHWMMGHLAATSWGDLRYLIPLVMGAVAITLWDARRIQLVQLGPDTAWHLGVDVTAVERRMLFASCLLTASAVAAAGMIGFVGLITPHIVRRLFGSDFRILFPMSLASGASLLVISDTVARTILAPGELPVGVLTAALGAPVFLFLLRRKSSL